MTMTEAKKLFRPYIKGTVLFSSLFECEHILFEIDDIQFPFTGDDIQLNLVSLDSIKRKWFWPVDIVKFKFKIEKDNLIIFKGKQSV